MKNKFKFDHEKLRDKFYNYILVTSQLASVSGFVASMVFSEAGFSSPGDVRDALPFPSRLRRVSVVSRV